DRDAVLLTHARLGEGEPPDRLRRVHLHDREAVVELDEVDHAPRDEVGDALAGLRLRVDDVVGTDAAQDLAVRLADRLRPDLRDLEVDEVGGDEHARLDRAADRDDRDLEVLGADLAQRVDRSGVGLHGVGDALGPLLHERHVLVDREHVTVQALQLSRGRGAEASEADDEHRSVVGDPLNQRWASPRGGGRAAAGWTPRAPRRVSLYRSVRRTWWRPGCTAPPRSPTG